ncbi:uncharacterized protein ACWYII_037568 [Salvelinus alpinus]
MVLVISLCGAQTQITVSEDETRINEAGASDKQTTSQADIWTELRELRAGVKKIGAVAVEHKMELTAARSQVTALGARLRASQAQELVVLDVRLNSTVAEAGEQKKDLTRQKTEVVQLWSEHFARELKALNAKSNNTEIQLEEQGAEVGKLRAMVDNLKKVEVVALWREHYAQARELEVLISRSNNTEIQLQEQESEVVELRGEVDELKKASS